MPVGDLGQFRSGTAATWASVNPTLSLGEPGWANDASTLKIGTGTESWTALDSPFDFMAKAAVRFTGTSTTRIVAKYHGGTITAASTDHQAVIQAAVDYVQQNSGGDLWLGPGTFNVDDSITGTAVSTNGSGASAPVRMHGVGAMQTPPFGAGTQHGTVLKWAGGNSTKAVLDISSDCHAWVVDNLIISGNFQANYGILAAGAHIDMHHLRITQPRGQGDAAACIRVVNGPTDEQDRYAGVSVTDTIMRAGSSAWGFRCDNADGADNGPRKCTDGHLRNVKILQCEAGQCYLGSGGWELGGTNHFTSGNTSLKGLVVAGSYANISGTYFDIVGEDANVELNANQIAFVNNHIACDNKTVSAPALKVAGDSITIMGNTFSGAVADSVTYFVKKVGTPARVSIIGNIGTGLGVATNGFTDFVDGGTYTVFGNQGS